MDTTAAILSPDQVLSQDQALCHLFFHCCLEDEEFTEAEMNDLSAKLVVLGLYPKMNFRDELVQYRRYRPTIADEQEYLRHLLKLINAVNDLALFSYCVELCIDDPVLDPREQALLSKISKELGIQPETADTVVRLFAQRKVAETQHMF
ncbi:MAG TPA: hypothetical protein VNU72_04715 [Puia sp.]|jgi:hypothetical protein|nr:hypothetical protein [Puia sp.]